MTSKVHQPHDKLVKKLLSNPAAAKDILSIFLPKEVKSSIDLNYLELQRDSFIDDEHRAFAVDLLYKTIIANQEGYLWILVEHQRRDDYWLPVRIFVYIALIWDHIRRTSKNKESKIPLVYPLIIFNGDKPYSHSLKLEDLIESESSKKLFRNLFTQSFPIIDLPAIKDDALRKHAQSCINGIPLLMTLKHIDEKDIQPVFENFLLEYYKKLDKKGGRDELADLLYYLLNEANFSDKKQFWSIIDQEFSPEVEHKMTTIAQQLKAEGRKEGLEKGIEKGIEMGMEKVALNLLKKKLDMKLIAETTGFTVEKIRKLKVQSTKH